MANSKKRSFFNRYVILATLILLVILFTPIPKRKHNLCITIVGTDCQTSTWSLEPPIALRLIGKLIYMNPIGSTQNQTPTPTLTLPEKVQRQGLVRIIVSVYVEEPPENWTQDSALEAAYKQNIAEAQNSLLADLAAYQIKDVRKFEIVPAMGITVDAKALQFLYNSPKVRAIEENQLHYTQ